VERLLPEREHLVELITTNDYRADLHFSESAEQTDRYSPGRIRAGWYTKAGGSVTLKMARSDPKRRNIRAAGSLSSYFCV
jgi:hypothetical protein